MDVCLVVVPAVEEDPHHEKGRVLVGPGDRGVNILCFAKVVAIFTSLPGVAQQKHPLGVEFGQQVRRRGVYQGDPAV